MPSAWSGFRATFFCFFLQVHIKWKEVLDYKRELLRMLSIGTGWNVEKLDQVGG